MNVKLHQTLLLLCSLLLSGLCSAQVISLTYDASKGTSSLQDAASIYMHSGAGTNAAGANNWDVPVGNWGQDDGVGEMTHVGGTFWTIDLDLQQYYGLATGETVYYIGIVFRNAQGNATGKDYSNDNIYVRGLNTQNPEAVQSDGTPFDGLEVQLYTTGLEELIPQTGRMNLHVFPNPFAESLNVAYEVEQAQHLKIEVLSLAGTKISTLYDGFQSPGIHKVQWAVDERLAPGGYLVHMRGDKSSYAQYIVFSK